MYVTPTAVLVGWLKQSWYGKLSVNVDRFERHEIMEAKEGYAEKPGFLGNLERRNEIVANWVALKGLVAVHTSNVEQPIPEPHYRRVHAFEGAPPNTMRVWIGRRWNLTDPNRPSRAQLFESHFMPVTNVFPGFPLPPDLERYRSEGGVFNATVFRVGHFFALALQHDWPGLRARPKLGSAAADALLPIWPAGRTIQWPPPRPVEDLGDPHKVTRFLQLAPPLAPVSGP